MRYVWLLMVVVLGLGLGCQQAKPRPVDMEYLKSAQRFPPGTPVRVKGLNITGTIFNYRYSRPIQFGVRYIPQPRGMFGGASVDYIYVLEPALERIK